LASPPKTPPPTEVAWFIKGLGPGGAEHLLVAHAAHADRARFRLRAYYVVPWKSQLVAELERLGVPCECLASGRRADLRWVFRLRHRLRNRQVDVLHVHSPLLASVVRLLVRTLRQRPGLVTTEHNVWPRHARATRALNRLTVGLEDAMVAVSVAVRDSMPARVRRRVEVITHGIDLDAVRAAAPERDTARAELGVGPDAVVCVTVANLRTEKGYDTLLAAVARTDAAEVTFVAAGQGPLADALTAERRRLGVEDRFRFLGYRTDVPRVLAAADLFVLASRHEGLPVALMEAMALGLPVVATAVGGVPEAVHDGVEGLLVAPDDPSALAAAIVALVHDPERRAAMGSAARVAAERFGAERPVRRLEAIYGAVRR
jgi:glycosyltransferase involved in cell wall biosynthesis